MIDKLLKLTLVVIFTLVINSILIALSSKYFFEDDKKEICLEYKVDFSKAVTRIHVSTIKSKEAFLFKIDYAPQGEPEAIFIDLNGDSFKDILLKIGSEESYYPFILFNDGNRAFKLAYEFESEYYFDYDIYIDHSLAYSKGKKPEYYLRDIDGDGKKELVFFTMTISKQDFLNVSFHLTEDNMGYYLFKKTKLERK